MNKKTIIKTGSLLLPAAVVAASCGFSILLHQPDIAQSDNINESALAAEISDDSKQSSVLEKDVSGSTVQESVKPENMSNESAQNSAAASETSKHISGKTNKKNNISASENSNVQISQTSGSSTSPVNQTVISQTTQNSPTQSTSQTTNTPGSLSVTSNNTPANGSTGNTNTSSPAASEYTSQSTSSAVKQTQQQTQQIQQQTQSPQPTAPQQTTTVTQPSETYTEPAVQQPVPSELSVAEPEPVGRYIDGIYQSTAEVNGVEEEGFLYDLEVTVTVSGGQISDISARIKNDRSEDPESNDAYVRRAVKKLSSVIIANQGIGGVDVISNATYSSNAFLSAASSAIASAER